MCKQVQSVTLQTAIFMQAKEFAASNVPFSVHDITRILRVKTAQGELEIPEVEVSGASFRFDIPHAKVKALFDELDRTSAFDADFTTTRTFNGTRTRFHHARCNSELSGDIDGESRTCSRSSFHFIHPALHPPRISSSDIRFTDRNSRSYQVVSDQLCQSKLSPKIKTTPIRN